MKAEPATTRRDQATRSVVSWAPCGAGWAVGRVSECASVGILHTDRRTRGLRCLSNVGLAQTLPHAHCVSEGVSRVANDGGIDLRRDALKVAYEQACKSYQGITDFRGKLLALLPLASGTGVFFLLERNEASEEWLAPIGLFGLVVTIGLFIYELRGIQRCHRLERQAGKLEEAMGLSEEEGGVLHLPKRRLNEMLGPPAASLIVYLAVILAWIYVAGVGREWWGPESKNDSLWAGGFGLGYVGLLFVGWLLVKWLDRDTSDGMLKKGDLGVEVRWVQRRLQMHGFDPGAADGVFGSRTDTELRAFQTAKGLEVDGVVGPKASRALRAQPS